MDTLDTPLIRYSDRTLSANAVISIRFSRLWDLLSANQRQYALHLTNPTIYPATPPVRSLYTAYSWDDVPQSFRIAILTEFRRLPGVFHIGAE